MIKFAKYLYRREGLGMNTLNGVIPTYLGSNQYPDTLLPGCSYSFSLPGKRDAAIAVLLSIDGDVWVEVLPCSGAMRFRTFFGRGMSLCTRNALLCLAEAFRINNVQGFDSGQDIASACRDILCGALPIPHDGVYLRCCDDPDECEGGWLYLEVSGGVIHVDSDWHFGPPYVFRQPLDGAVLSERAIYNALVLLVHAIAQDNKTQPQYPLGDG